MHAAALGELQRIAEQVEQDLAHPRRIAQQRVGRARRRSPRPATGPCARPAAGSVATTPSTSPVSENGVSSSSSRPASILEKSSTSSMMRSSAWADSRMVATVRAWPSSQRPGAPAPPSCRARRSSACGSRGSWWRGRSTWPGWRPPPARATSRRRPARARGRAGGGAPRRRRSPARRRGRRRRSPATRAPTCRDRRGSGRDDPSAAS